MSEKLELKVIFSAVDKFLRPVKAITDGARNASKALKETKGVLKDLEAQQKLIDSFRSTGKAIGITGQDLEKARALVKKLALEMAATEVPTVKMQRAFAKASDDARNLAANANRLAEKKQRLRQELSAAGIDTKNLANQQRELKSRLDAATESVTRQGAALEAENKKMQRLHAAQADLAKSKALREKIGGTGAKLAIAGAAVNAAGAIPVMAYAKAEDSATQLKVAMMQSGGKISAQFKDINDLAEKLGNKLPGTTSDYQDMMTMLIRQGMPAKALLGGLGEATAYLAVQLKMAPTAAAELASKLQDATRTTDKDMMGLMDTIQKTFYLGVDQTNMLQGFSKLSPALSILKKEGLGAAQVLAPLLVMTDQAGMAGEAAGNAYRKILQLSMDAKKLAKGNAELTGTGIKLDFTDGKGEFGGLEKMYVQLEKLKGVNTQKRLAALKKIFGDDAETLQALTIMIEKGADGYREVQGKMAAQANIQERVNLQLKTLKNLWDAASGTFTNALVAFGESVAPELHASAEFLGKLAERTQLFAKENPGFAHAIMTTVKYLGLLLVVLGVLATGAAAILGPIGAIRFGLVALGLSGFSVTAMLGGAFRLIASGIGLIGRALLMNPIGLTLTGIAVAALLIYTYWEPIKAFFSGLWGQVTQAFNGGLLAILALIANWSPLGLFYQAMAGVLSYFGIELPGKFTEFGANLMNGLTTGITNGIQAARDAIGSAGDAVIGYFKEKLGIRSPSRVFEELGGFTMQGLEQGLTGNADGALSAMASMAKKLAGIGAGLTIGGTAMAHIPELPAIPPNLPQAPLAAQRQITDNHQAAQLSELAPTLRSITDRYQALALPSPPAALRQITDDHQPAQLPELAPALRSIIDQHQALALPSPPAAMRQVTDDHQPAKLPELVPVLRSIIDQHQSLTLPNPFAALRQITDDYRSKGLPDPEPALRAIRSTDIPLDMRPPLSPATLPGAGGAGSAGNTYQITINAAPGTDNAGLAALVGREIERIESQKAARQRSRLRDAE